MVVFVTCQHLLRGVCVPLYTRNAGARFDIKYYHMTVRCPKHIDASFGVVRVIEREAMAKR